MEVGEGLSQREGKKEKRKKEKEKRKKKKEKRKRKEEKRKKEKEKEKEKRKKGKRKRKRIRKSNGESVQSTCVGQTRVGQVTNVEGVSPPGCLMGSLLEGACFH